jgi:tRNA (cmo5U34)-methyltransferase
MSAVLLNEYAAASRVMASFARGGKFPHRAEGEAVFLELLPEHVERVLVLGTGDGRLLAILRAARPYARVVTVDSSPVMLARARERFAEDPAVCVLDHDFERPLSDLGTFDLVVSSFTIHRLSDERKLALYAEVFRCLEPGGLFCNLEHVSSPTPALHDAFCRALGIDLMAEDASNECVSVERQLVWLARIGFADADCYWKWREFALIAGVKPNR